MISVLQRFFKMVIVELLMFKLRTDNNVLYYFLELMIVELMTFQLSTEEISAQKIIVLMTFGLNIFARKNSAFTQIVLIWHPIVTLQIKF